MRQYQKVFMALLARGIFNAAVQIPELAGKDEWDALLRFSAQQNVLPLVCDMLCRTKTRKAPDMAEFKKACSRGVDIAMRQTRQTNEFLTLLLRAQEKGLDPVVIKGVVCRSLYPMPCLRPSVDEDLLIPAEDTEKYHLLLMSEGFSADQKGLSERERARAAELSYHREHSPSYVELHKHLFDPQSEIFGRFNLFFEDLFSRTVRISIEDVSVRTLAPTEHLLYLVLHAYKHFLHSGIGIRPLCDIGLYAETYAAEINWDEIRNSLKSVHAFYFTRALFRILELYLLPDGCFFALISDWALSEINIEALLSDCMESGVHGASSLTRLHSSNMTLHAARNRKAGGSGGYAHAILHSVFPPPDDLENRYTYLKKRRILLPAAWLQRAVRYCRETGKKDTVFEANNDAAGSIRLGRKRIGLLRQYKIIE